MNIVISSGHGKLIRGASGYIDEVDEARRVVNKISDHLMNASIGVTKFHDDVSTSQDENLDRIVEVHNFHDRDLDVSVHFNAYKMTASPMGTECFYVTQDALAQRAVTGISQASGLLNRGPKKRTDLFFLNKTDAPAILIEVCFVDSRKDVELYEENFDEICEAICSAISGVGETASSAPEKLLVIPPVTIWKSHDGSYVAFQSDLDVCNDGTGPNYDDPSYQPETAYYNGGKYLNADKDKYIVIPPQIRSMLSSKVMGCQGQLTNIKTGVSFSAVVGDIGPDDKTGEAAYCLAKLVNPSISHNSGDGELIYLYELWPGVPAVVGDKTYKLE
jgi:N-acetylmuramoyl-L-alanine amidase